MTTVLSLTLKLSVPIVLGALCGTISERAGVIMLGVEGMMLFGAFFAVFGTFLTGNPWLGMMLAIIVGAILGWLYCLFCLKFKGHQSVIGVGLNMLASGLTQVLLKSIWGREGMSDFIPTISNWKIPALQSVPVLNAIFSDQSPYFYMMIIIVISVWFVFYKTKIGLRYRAIGDHPLAVKTVGINVNKYRYVGLTIAGMLASLGGSFLSISYNNLFVADMVAGRGFMALGASIFGGWTPLGCLFASMVFAFAQALSYTISDVSIPIYFIQMIPYVTTIIILMFTGRTVHGPEALGKLVD